SQTALILLNVLEKLTLGGNITKIEKDISQYSYHLVSARNHKYNNKDYEAYDFKKTENGAEQLISILKEISSDKLITMISYKVIYSTFQRTIFDSYRQELQQDTT